MTHRAPVDTCYLCGKAMGKDRSRDHVPPQSFFPEPLRKARNFSKLWVVAAHPACNGAFKLDEQYFFQSLAPLARRTQVGSAIWQVIDKPILTPREVQLRQRIAREFYMDPSGQMRKTFEHDRLYRVAKKIVRGLHFIAAKSVLPDEWKYEFRLCDPVNAPPQEILASLGSEPSWGEYPEIFFFKIVRNSTLGMQMWMLFFWDWAVILVFVHEDQCKCERCASAEAPSNSA